MVICPKCGNKLQFRKIFFLSNLNAITCQVCSSKLRAKNKEVNSLIGGLGAVIGSLLLIWGFSARNVLFLALTVVFLAMVLVILLLLVDKYVKVELEYGSKIDKLPIYR